MKNSYKIILLFMAFLIAVPILNSCKKGDEDPWFSFYSRKTRLCQDWKITSYKRIVQTNDSIVAYTFNGETFTKISSHYSYASPGSMRIIFSKTGSYEWSQSSSTDTSNYQYVEKGMWYFSGGGKESDTKNQELVVMQRTEQTESFSDGGSIQTLSYNGSGDLSTNVFHLKKLASDGAIIESEVTTTFVTLGGSDLQKITTEIVLEPK